MIQLLSHDIENGWAVAKEVSADGKETYFLVRPPYHVDENKTCVEPSAVEKSIEKHGFTRLVEPSQFETLSLLYKFLEDDLYERYKDDPRINPANAAGLLKYAPPDVINKCLDALENEFLQNNKITAARKMIDGIMILNQVRNNDALYARAYKLSQKVCTLETSDAAAVKFSDLTGMTLEKSIKHFYPSISEFVFSNLVAFTSDMKVFAETDNIMFTGSTTLKAPLPI